MKKDDEPRSEGPKDDLFAAMPPLQAKTSWFAYVAGVREKRREQGQGSCSLVKALLNAKCEINSIFWWNPKSHVRVVVHGGHFTFAATELGQRKIRPKVCEWYDVKQREVLGSGKKTDMSRRRAGARGD